MVRKNKNPIKQKNYWGLEHISLIIRRIYKNNLERS